MIPTPPIPRSNKKHMVLASGSFHRPSNMPRTGESGIDLMKTAGIPMSDSFLNARQRSMNRSLLNASAIRLITEKRRSVGVPATSGWIKSDGVIITVVVKSNWGNESELRISSIAFLNEDRKHVRVLKVTSVPELPKASNVNRLGDPDIMKTQAFNAAWPPEGGDSISLVFLIDKSDVVRYVRVWNPSDGGDMCCKDVVIMTGTDIAFSGEIPRGFGLDCRFAPIDRGVELGEVNAVLESLFPHLSSAKNVQDDYGGYPAANCKTLKFEIASTYNSGRLDIGLNGIEFWGYDGSMLTIEDIEEIDMESCKSMTNPRILMRRDKRSVESSEMLAMKAPWPATPTLTFTFVKPMKIAMIRIWNFNGTMDSLGYGVKELRIRNGKRSAWYGKIPRGTGTLSYTPFRIWFTDLPSIRRLMS